jgi:hypothetical protein
MIYPKDRNPQVRGGEGNELDTKICLKGVIYSLDLDLYILFTDFIIVAFAKKGDVIGYFIMNKDDIFFKIFIYY